LHPTGSGTFAAVNPPEGAAARTALSWRTFGLSALGWLGFGVLLHWQEHVAWPRPNDPLWPGIVIQPLIGYGPYALLWPLLLRRARIAVSSNSTGPGTWFLPWLSFTVGKLALSGTGVWLHAYASAPKVELESLVGSVLGSVVSNFVFVGFQCAALTGAAAAIAQRSQAAAIARQAAQLREELLTAQLSVLRARLQPHFLFNALHAVAVVARHDGDKAERMLTCLGDLLRLSLQPRPQHLVPLRDELALLRPYLELQQIRFADRLHLTVSVPEALLTMAVPDLLLQPLVENALHHGIEARSGPGTVTISARAVDGRLHIAIEDDGVGVAGNPTEGIGLGTTRARLQGLFGDAAQLALRPRAGGGTVVEVSMPLSEAVNA
jgi:hypothetical protein